MSYDFSKRSQRKGRAAGGGEWELDFTPDEVAAFWDKVALGHYEEANERQSASHRQRFEISLPLLDLKPGQSLLNCWSRQGEAIPLCRKLYPGIKLKNAEISRVMLEQATQRFPEEEFYWTDLCSLPFSDNQFDAVLSLEMLEHSPSPRRILAEFHRVLKPGGKLVLTCPAIMGEFYLWILDTFFDNHGEGPHRMPAVGEVIRDLKAAGFQDVHHQATLFFPRELGAWTVPFNFLAEKICQLPVIRNFGMRQLYWASKGRLAR